MVSISEDQLVYKSNACSIHQDDDLGCFQLQFYGEILTLKLCGLINLRKKIDAINTADLLLAEGSDCALVYLAEVDRFFLFSLQQTLELKSLLQGAFVMLHINSIIHEYTIRKFS